MMLMMVILCGDDGDCDGDGDGDGNDGSDGDDDVDVNRCDVLWMAVWAQDEQPRYHYHLTKTYPWSIGCFKVCTCYVVCSYACTHVTYIRIYH